MNKILISTVSVVFTALLVGCAKSAEPETGSLFGTIYDFETNNPVKGASVLLSPGTQTTSVGDDGHYEFINLQAGQYKITVRANGYQSNSRQVFLKNLKNNRSTNCDIAIPKVKEISGIKLSAGKLDFAEDYSALILSIYNVGNSGAVSWVISGIDVPWMTVLPRQGETAMGKSSDVKVTIDRNSISSPQSTFLIVNANGESQPIAVNVDVAMSSADNNDGTGAGKEEDYSFVSIDSCHESIIPEIIGCKRSGSAVTFTYKLTNQYKNIEDWRIYPPAVSAPTGGKSSNISDDEGNDYLYPKMTFGTAYTTGTVSLNTRFYKGTTKGTVTLSNVPETVRTIDFFIGVYAYPAQNYELKSGDDQPSVTFSGVPIY